MKPPDLEKHLRAANVPDRGAAYWANFPESVKRRLGTERPPAERRRMGWLPASVAVGTAVGGVVLGFFLWHRPAQALDAYSRLKSGQALYEALPRYLGRLQAIEQDGNGLRLVLSKERDVPPSLPVWVEIYESGHRRSLVIFSGQSFRFGGGDIEVLANPEGQVMLVGEDFLWTNRGKPAATDGMRVEARLLPKVF
jgi:hypothetical protein